MKLLHVFAGPFPTVQGTQALVGQICRLLAERGHEVHLLCYAHGRASEPGRAAPPFAVHRIPDVPRFACERSGPSWRKAALDASLTLALHRLAGRLAPDIVHAHHYEALAAARLALARSGPPLVFHLHSLFGPELPTYFPRIMERPAALAGAWCDRAAPWLADAVIALSPAAFSLAHRYSPRPDRVHLIRPPAEPWNPPLPVAAPIPSSQPAIRAVYIGNLDAYQNLEALLRGVAALDPELKKHFRLIVITDSDIRYFRRKAEAMNLGRFIDCAPHGNPANAWSRAAAADFVVIPRRLPGGAPIKLVNALGLGLPTLIDAGLDPDLVHGAETWKTDMSDPRAIAAGLALLGTDPAIRRRLSSGARAASDRLHDPERNTAALEAVCAGLFRR